MTEMHIEENENGKFDNILTRVLTTYKDVTNLTILNVCLTKMADLTTFCQRQRFNGNDGLLTFVHGYRKSDKFDENG